MNQSNYNRVAGMMFVVIAAVHLVRYVLKISVMFGTRPVPLWLSLVPVVIGGYLAFCAFRLNKGT